MKHCFIKVENVVNIVKESYISLHELFSFIL